MRKILLLIFLFAAFAGFGQTTRYVDWTNGNDANAGTNINIPKKHLEAAFNASSAGDTIYVRGGTHQVESGYKATSQVNRIYFFNKNGTSSDSIYIWNYPGESPVFDLDIAGMDGSSGDGITGWKIEQCNYLSIKGIRITNIHQPTSGNNSPAGVIFFRSDHNRFKNCTIDNIQGYGLYLQGRQDPGGDGSDFNHILNVDVHHCYDLYTSFENSNGFNITGGDLSHDNLIEGCRAWLISDDGFDCFGTDGYNTFRNCWSFVNGYWESSAGTYTHESGSDGDGFKLGPTSTNNASNPTAIRRVEACLAYGNYTFGFDQNAGTTNTGKYELYNNSALNNGSSGYFFGANTGIAQVFKNNISNTGINGTEINSGANVSTNSWNGFTVTSGDFQSLPGASTNSERVALVAILGAARQADGSLPVITAGRLTNTSDMYQAGSNQGFGLDLGALPYAVTNASPSANAGSDQSITLPTSSVSLTGGGTDADGTIVSYAWTKVSGGSATIVSASSQNTSVTGLSAGVYVFRLTVTDDDGATGTDNIQVTVNAAPSGNTRARKSRHRIVNH